MDDNDLVTTAWQNRLESEVVLGLGITLEDPADDESDRTLDLMMAGIDASGCADLWFCRVKCTFNQQETGDHLKAAERFAAKEGYEAPGIVFDPMDPTYDKLHPLFEWDSATTYDITKDPDYTT